MARANSRAKANAKSASKRKAKPKAKTAATRKGKAKATRKGKAKATPKAKAKATPKAKAKAKAKAKTRATVKAKAKPKAKQQARAKAKPPARVIVTANPDVHQATESPAPSTSSIVVNVRIREPVPPIDRGERYEDPVFDALEDAGLGEPGDGGGTLCSPEGEIVEVDFDVGIRSADALSTIIDVLEKAGAPKGSQLAYTDSGVATVRSFGVAEGIAVYLDGVSQPKEHYETCNAQELVDKLLAVLDDGEFRGSWAGPRETALYLYGSDAESMFGRIESVLREYPLSRNARVVVRHGDPDSAREIRLAAN